MLYRSCEPFACCCVQHAGVGSQLHRIGRAELSARPGPSGLPTDARLSRQDDRPTFRSQDLCELPRLLARLARRRTDRFRVRGSPLHRLPHQPAEIHAAGARGRSDQVHLAGRQQHGRRRRQRPDRPPHRQHVGAEPGLSASRRVVQESDRATGNPVGRRDLERRRGNGVLRRNRWRDGAELYRHHLSEPGSAFGVA